MRYGGGIFLIVLGLILALAVPGQVGSIDVETIGWICVGAGVLALALGLLTSQRRSSSETVVQNHGGAVAPPVAGHGETVVREERRDNV